MLLIQLFGLSGAGKSTIAQAVKEKLGNENIHVEILDGDQVRKTLHKDLGFSKADRNENIRRMGALASSMSTNNHVIIIAAVNPYESIRQELEGKYGAKTIWLNCSLRTLIGRDTKGLYKRAMLPNDHPDKIYDLSGVNDVFEEPVNPDLVIDTEENSIEESVKLLSNFISMSRNG